MFSEVFHLLPTSRPAIGTIAAFAPGKDSGPSMLAPGAWLEARGALRLNYL